MKKQWLVAAVAVTLIVPSLTLAEYGSGGGSSALSAIEKASKDFGKEKDKGPQSREDLEKEALGLIDQLQITQAKKEQLSKLVKDTNDIVGLRKKISDIQKDRKDELKAREKENEDALDFVQSAVPPVAPAINTQNVDNMDQQCKKSEVQGHLSGMKQVASTLGEDGEKLKSALTDVLEDDTDSNKKKLKKAAKEFRANLAKALAEDERGKKEQKKLKDFPVDGTSEELLDFYAEKGFKWAKNKKAALGFQLADELEKIADERSDDRRIEGKVAAAGARFQQTLNQKIVDAEGKGLAAAGTMTERCQAYEGKVRGQVGIQQPSENSLRGSQGRVSEAFKQAIQAKNGLAAQDPQNQQQIALATQQLDFAIARRGRNLGNCPTGTTSQVQGAFDGARQIVAAMGNQRDAKLMADQMIVTVQGVVNKVSEAANAMNSVAGFCSVFAKESKTLEDQAARYGKEAAAAAQNGGAPGAFGPQPLTAGAGSQVPVNQLAGSPVHGLC